MAIVIAIVRVVIALVIVIVIVLVMPFTRNAPVAGPALEGCRRLHVRIGDKVLRWVVEAWAGLGEVRDSGEDQSGAPPYNML